MYNIYQTLKESAQNHPNKTAVVDEDGSFTYAQLHEDAEILKTALEKLGVKRGHSIGILTANNHRFLVALYACMATGAVVMPIYHHQQDDEITGSVVDARLHFVLSDTAERTTIIAPIATTLKTQKEAYYVVKTSISSTEQAASFISNPAFMRFTSGTTGAAKGVIIEHEKALERINAANKKLQISSNDTILWVFPMAYHFVVSVILYVREVATIIINNSFLADDIIASIRKHRVTFFYCSPMHIKLLASAESEQNLPSLRFVISTTTGASHSDCIAFTEKYGLAVHQAFGIIEVGLPIINLQSAESNPEAVGHVLPDYEAAILDETLKPLKENLVGQLGLKGPGMFSGYLNPQKPIKEILKNGWFLTGDLAMRNMDGLITIKGRKKNVIIIHGNKVFPSEIETVINQFDGIERSRAFGKKHNLFGEIVAIDIVCDKPIEKGLLIKHCKDHLSGYKVPQVVNVVEEIEMTASGKIKRH